LPNAHRQTSHWLVAFCALSLSACALVSPPQAASQPPADTLPAQWQTPLPHQGTLVALSQWWQTQGDPLLVQLIGSAQSVSPSLASARSRLEQARAALGGTQAASLPGLNASLSAQRGINATSPTVGTALQSSLDATWEIDLFGANRANTLAAQARLQGAQAQWHEARVSVAAETATLYFNWRNCQRLLSLLEEDAQSRSQTAGLAELSAKAGFMAPASAALARASSAEGQARAIQQRTQCGTLVNALVALTGIEAAQLRQQLAAAPQSTAFDGRPSIASVPAELLAQRPDVYSAEREVAAASADLGAAQAQRYPRLMLSGSVGALNFSNAAGTIDLSTWSIGPVLLSIPLLDGGRRAAGVQAAQARYEEAAALYRARVRQAVREVEDALLALQGTESRSSNARAASTGYQQAFEAMQARQRAGAASVMELEDSRRTLLAAQSAVLQLELERRTAWVTLYRALGGGWRADDTSQP
jgi:outer membrane protein, multidrug efflux system